ncbi:unnamed protein product [Larinioides sclopetarius]|uniref:Uncharacterized protein n=1 Tax=Larinioides sclopetarius TaxID=280406 RepID=A0AAV2AGY9_9ARAC
METIRMEEKENFGDFLFSLLLFLFLFVYFDVIKRIQDYSKERLIIRETVERLIIRGTVVKRCWG